MNKYEYISNVHVKGFAEWAAENLTNETFSNTYGQRKTRKTWACTSLWDAYKNYVWPTKPTTLVQMHSSVQPGSDFSTSVAILGVLKAELEAAFNDDNLVRATTAAVDVMTWGGVRGGNVSWLKDSNTQKTLLQTLQSITNAINTGNTEDPALNDKGLRFNAGMTKVYSLTCDNFIIYDSRVGACLGWMVSKYCKEKGLTSVPEELCFPWAPAKESNGHLNPKRRDPSSNGLKFPRLRSGPHHAQWNMKASWTLEEILKHPCAATSEWKKEVSSDLHLRSLEAAMFMIGYDLALE